MSIMGGGIGIGPESRVSVTAPERTFPREVMVREATELSDMVLEALVQSSQFKYMATMAWVGGITEISHQDEKKGSWWRIQSSTSSRGKRLSVEKSLSEGFSIRTGQNILGGTVCKVTFKGPDQVAHTNSRAAIDGARALIEKLKADFVTETPKENPKQ